MGTSNTICSLLGLLGGGGEGWANALLGVFLSSWFKSNLLFPLGDS